MDALIAFRYFGGPGVLGAECIQESHRGHAADGELRRFFKEDPTLDYSVYVLVEEGQNLLRELVGLHPLAGHRASMLCGECG